MVNIIYDMKFSLNIFILVICLPAYLGEANEATKTNKIEDPLPL